MKKLNFSDALCTHKRRNASNEIRNGQVKKGWNKATEKERNDSSKVENLTSVRSVHGVRQELNENCKNSGVDFEESKSSFEAVRHMLLSEQIKPAE